MTTLNNRPNNVALTGEALLAKVREEGERLSKVDLCIACGYIRGYQDDGTPVPAFADFYEALLVAKGFQAEQVDEVRQAIREDNPEEEPLLSGLSREEFVAAVKDEVHEMRKLLSYDQPIVDKVSVLIQLSALINVHQEWLQAREAAGENTQAYIDDIEKLNTCRAKLLSVHLGENDHWYMEEPTKAPAPMTVGLQVFTDVVKRANKLQAEVDSLQAQLDAKKGGLLHRLFPRTF